MLPDDAQIWTRREAAGDATPFSAEGVRFLTEGEQPSALDSSHLTDEDRQNADIMANLAAMDDTAALITWVAEHEDEGAYGYWRGPQNTPLDQCAIVRLDSEGQFGLTPGRSISEALCWELGEYADEGFDGLADACREAGIEIADDEDSVPEGEVSTQPADFHEERYRARGGF